MTNIDWITLLDQIKEISALEEWTWYESQDEQNVVAYVAQILANGDKIHEVTWRNQRTGTTYICSRHRCSIIHDGKSSYAKQRWPILPYDDSESAIITIFELFQMAWLRLL